MQPALTSEQATVMAHDMLVENSLKRLVEQHRGLKDTELAMLVVAEHETSLDRVFGAIRQMLREGRLVGIEYCWHETPGTFILPATAKAVVPIPVQVVEKRTFH